MTQQRVLVWIFVGACTSDRAQSAARDDLPPPEPENCPVKGSAPRPMLGPDQIAACPMLDPDQVAGWVQNMGHDNYKCRQGSGTVPMRNALSTFITGDGTNCDDIIARSAAADRCLDSLIAMLPPTAAEQRSRLAMLKGMIPASCPTVFSHAGKCPSNTMQTGTTSILQCVFGPPIPEVSHGDADPVAKAECVPNNVNFECTCENAPVAAVACGSGDNFPDTSQYAASCNAPFPDDADFALGLDDSCVATTYLLDLTNHHLEVYETIEITPLDAVYDDVAKGNQEAIDDFCADVIQAHEALYYGQLCRDDPRAPANQTPTRILNVPCCKPMQN